MSFDTSVNHAELSPKNTADAAGGRQQDLRETLTFRTFSSVQNGQQRESGIYTHFRELQYEKPKKGTLGHLHKHL